MYGLPCKRGPKPKPFRACHFPGCGGRAWGDHAYCHMHAMRVRRHGDPTTVLTRRKKVRDAD